MTTNGHRRRKLGRGMQALVPDLAEGSHRGNEPDPTMAVFVAAVDAGNVLRAELDCAIVLLRQLVGALARQGSYTPPEDQDALRAARRFLIDRAK